MHQHPGQTRCPGWSGSPCRPLSPVHLPLRLLPFVVPKLPPAPLPSLPRPFAQLWGAAAPLHRPPAAGRRCGKRVPSSTPAGRLATSLPMLLACMAPTTTVNGTEHPPVLADTCHQPTTLTRLYLLTLGPAVWLQLRESWSWNDGRPNSSYVPSTLPGPIPWDHQKLPKTFSGSYILQLACTLELFVS